MRIHHKRDQNCVGCKCINNNYRCAHAGYSMMSNEIGTFATSNRQVCRFILDLSQHVDQFNQLTIDPSEVNRRIDVSLTTGFREEENFQLKIDINGIETPPIDN